MRKPVTVSSRTKRLPFARARVCTPCEVAGVGGNHADVGHDSLGDDRRDLPAPGVDRPIERVEVVPRHDDRVFERTDVQPRALRNPDRIAPVSQRTREVRVRADQEVVVPAVVVPFELDELRPPGVTAGQSEGGHRRLGAGVREPHALGAGHHSIDAARRPPLRSRWRPQTASRLPTASRTASTMRGCA